MEKKRRDATKRREGRAVTKAEETATRGRRVACRELVCLPLVLSVNHSSSCRSSLQSFTASQSWKKLFVSRALAPGRTQISSLAPFLRIPSLSSAVHATRCVQSKRARRDVCGKFDSSGSPPSIYLRVYVRRDASTKGQISFRCSRYCAPLARTLSDFRPACVDEFRDTFSIVHRDSLSRFLFPIPLLFLPDIRWDRSIWDILERS